MDKTTEKGKVDGGMNKTESCKVFSSSDQIHAYPTQNIFSESVC